MKFKMCSNEFLRSDKEIKLDNIVKELTEQEKDFAVVPYFQVGFDMKSRIISIAHNIYNIRKLFNLRQEELAEKANVSRATIVQLEKGAGDPQLSTLVKVSEALNINLFLLFINRIEFDAIIKLFKEEGNTELLSDIELINKNLEDLENLEKNKTKNKKYIFSEIGTTLLPGVGTVFLSLLGENLE